MDKIYIAYGANLNLEKMKKRCPMAKPIGTTFLRDYKLFFRKNRGGAVATVEPMEGASVPVLLWKITEPDEIALDHYECFPSLYRKETVKVDLDKETINAMIYIMNEGKPLAKPSNNYYTIILKGYNSFGFDVDFLKQAVDDSVKARNIEKN